MPFYKVKAMKAQFAKRFTAADSPGHIYRDFFGLSTYDLSVAFAGLDFSYWFDWSFSFPDLSINVHLLLTQIAKMSYSIGLISFLIENVFAVAEDFTK